MKIILKIFIILFLFTSFATAQIILDNEVKQIVLLNKSEIYFDKTNKKSIYFLIQKPELFESYHKEYINNGLKNKHPVWIKFTLYNDSSQTIHRTLSIDELKLEHIELYVVKNNKVLYMKKAGALNKEEFKGILMPNFQIKVLPNEKRDFYLKVLTSNFALSFKALLTSKEDFLYKDIKHHLVLTVFVTLFLSVFIYNLILFFLTRDSIYFYYALFVLGMLAPIKSHYILWLHIFPMYDPSFMLKEISLKVYYTNFTSLTMILFAQKFLQTNQYPKVHMFLNFSIVMIIIHTFLTSPTFLSYQDVVPFYFFLLLSSFFIGFYALYKRNKNALYFIFGWGLSVLAWIAALLHGFNIWSIKYDFYYISQTLLTLEVFLFSYAISQYIRRLNNEKEELSQKLIEQKENENIKLEKTVKEKTKNLKKELKTNKFLLQELNHRVKNNMQFITSLYALKLSDNEEAQEKIQDIERKVQAMSQVHQMLYTQKNSNYIKADSYFESIIKNIQESFYIEDIKFIYNIQITLNLEEAIYCGLIVNELVTNAIKYAFEKNKGEITIILKEDQRYKYLKVEDNGRGIEKNDSNGFGQMLIETLATQQLNGKIDIDTTSGTKVMVSFPKL